VFQLGEAVLDGDASRALRILEGLRAEGSEPPLVLWALCRELRSLAEAQSGAAKPAYGQQAERRATLVARAAERMRGVPLEPFFAAAAGIDRQAKGLARGDAWTSLTGLVARFAGASLPVAPAS
jgi:DNA polymerase-3 subunit delta